MNRYKDEIINDVIDLYEEVMFGIEKKALNSKDRAYGGVLRNKKGSLLEKIAKMLVIGSWEVILGRSSKRIKFGTSKFKVPIKREYLETLENENISNYIKKNINDFYYNIGIDLHVYVDENFVLGVECKNYTENAMMKRVLFDMKLINQATGLNNFILLQLESQLGGDYHELKPLEETIGSSSTRTLLSHFNIEPRIITLLEGKRKVSEPIHKEKYQKELKYENVERALHYFADILEDVKV